jgi:hypothetical protein
MKFYVKPTLCIASIDVELLWSMRMEVQKSVVKIPETTNLESAVVWK